MAYEHKLPPRLVMLQLIQGFWVLRALYVAAYLGIPDLLKDGSKSSEELAQATGTHAPSLYHLLRELARSGVFAEDDHRCFALTPLGATLRSEVPGSLRVFAVKELGRDHYVAREAVLRSIQTGPVMQQGDGYNKKGGKIHLQPNDENDDPLAIMW